jgi:hypothetical protein
LHDKGLYNVYTLPGIVRIIKLRIFKCMGHVTYLGEMRHRHRILVRKCGRKRPFRRFGHRRVCIIEMKGMEYKSVD